MSPDLDTVERGRDGGTMRGSDVVRQQAVEGGKRVRRRRRDRGQNSTGANEEKDWVRAWGRHGGGTRGKPEEKEGAWIKRTKENNIKE